jgi:hypothetical protein
MPEAPELDDLELATRPDPKLPPLTGYTFKGYKNKDGCVGTKNILGITTSVNCVEGGKPPSFTTMATLSRGLIFMRRGFSMIVPCIHLKKGHNA